MKMKIINQLKAKKLPGIIRCVIYCRVSTDEQARKENGSIETQDTICGRYIGVNEPDGWKTIRSIHDAGHSAKDLKRPGIKEMIELVRTGKLDVIVVYKLDRLTRSIRDFYDLWEICEEYGVELVSATEKLDTTTAMGRAFLNLLLTFAQFEREMTAQRLADKFAEEAQEGKKHPGMAPYGYQLDKSARSMMPDPNEARYVRMMFELMTELGGLAAVATAVNAQGARTKKRVYKEGTDEEQTIGGRPWTADKVKRIIERPDYKAVRVHHGNEYKARWEALVSAKLWQRANDALTNRNLPEKLREERNKYELSLKGILKCGHCGCAMSPKAGGKKSTDGSQRPYYSCQEVIRYGKSCQCDVRNLPGKELDAFVVNSFGRIGSQPEVIEATIQGAIARKEKSLRPLKSRLNEVNKEIRRIKAKLDDKLALAKRKDAEALSDVMLAEANELAKARKSAEDEREHLKNEIDLNQRVTTDQSVVVKTLRNFEAVFNALDFERRLQLMKLLVSEVRVSRAAPGDSNKKLPAGSLFVEFRKTCYRVDFDFRIDFLAKLAPFSA